MGVHEVLKCLCIGKLRIHLASSITQHAGTSQYKTITNWKYMKENKAMPASYTIIFSPDYIDLVNEKLKTHIHFQCTNIMQNNDL